MTLQDRQLPINRAILRHLVAATPESWTKIDYVVDVSREIGYESMFADITSPDGRDASEATVSRRPPNSSST